MYNKLPLKERIDLMKSYKKANPDMSYRDMVSDYNDSYQKFGNGGKKEVNREPIITNNLNDPRLKAYTDSLSIYNDALIKNLEAEFKYDKPPVNTGNYISYDDLPDFIGQGNLFDDRNNNRKLKFLPNKNNAKEGDMRVRDTRNITKNEFFKNQSIKPIGFDIYNSGYNKDNKYYAAKYKEPVQPYLYQLPEESPVKNTLIKQPTGENRQWNFNNPSYKIMEYKDNTGKVINKEYYNYNNTPITPIIQKHKYGGIQQFGNGGKLSYPQKMQAYNDSTILYNSGFNKNIPNPVYEPQFNAAKQRLTLLNNEEPQSTDKRPITTNPDYLQKRSVPYAKPTLPIPPKNNTSLGISKNDRTPIYTSDKNDPRLRAYNDSLATYNLSNKAEKLFNKNSSDPQLQVYNQMADKVAKRTNIKPVTIKTNSSEFTAKGFDPMSMQEEWMAKFKKPVQPYIYKKPEEKQVIDSIPKPLASPVQLFESKPEVVKKDTSNLPKEQFAKLGNQNWISTTVLRDGSHLRTYANGRTEVIPNPKKIK